MMTYEALVNFVVTNIDTVEFVFKDYKVTITRSGLEDFLGIEDFTALRDDTSPAEVIQRYVDHDMDVVTAGTQGPIE